MNAQDDELVKRYREASQHEDARPGLHVRSAVRAHAQMLAAAALSQTSSAAGAAPVTVRAAANASRWKISALASVALVGLTGLLMLQFERGTSDEKELAYGKPRTEKSADAVAPNAPPEAVAVAPASASASASASKSIPVTPGVGTRAAREPVTAGLSDPVRRDAKPELQAANPPAKAVPSAQHAETAAPPHREDAPSSFPMSQPSRTSPPSSPRLESTVTPLFQSRDRPVVQPVPEQDVMSSPSASSPARPPAAAARSTAPMPAAPATGNAHSKSTSNESLSAPSSAHSENSIFLENSLREAARAGRALDVESLVRRGVPVNASNSAGSTALMLAARHGQTSTVQKLLLLGANPALVDREGLTAAQQARRLGFTRIADLIDVGS